MLTSIPQNDNMVFLVDYWLGIAFVSALAIIALLGCALFLKHHQVKALRRTELLAHESGGRALNR